MTRLFEIVLYHEASEQIDLGRHLSWIVHGAISKELDAGQGYIPDTHGQPR